jgi:hypothetical protein
MQPNAKPTVSCSRQNMHDNNNHDRMVKNAHSTKVHKRYVTQLKKKREPNTSEEEYEEMPKETSSEECKTSPSSIAVRDTVCMWFL